jgi:phosphonate transport system permease protein
MHKTKLNLERWRSDGFIHIERFLSAPALAELRNWIDDIESWPEDIENADKGPQEALFAVGANKLKVLWFGVLPQVLPQYVAYTLYILDRNVRMATVIGIVGAGGIGQELKGRYEMFNYGHVTTILIVLFITVFLLDRLSALLRKKLI